MYETYLNVSAVFLISMLLGYMRSRKSGKRTNFKERNHLINEADMKVFKLIACLSFPYLKSTSLKYRNMLAARRGEMVRECQLYVENTTTKQHIYMLTIINMLLYKTISVLFYRKLNRKKNRSWREKWPRSMK